MQFDAAINTSSKYNDRLGYPNSKTFSLVYFRFYESVYKNELPQNLLALRDLAKRLLRDKTVIFVSFNPLIYWPNAVSRPKRHFFMMVWS
jgi:hypothetical protein